MYQLPLDPHVIPTNIQIASYAPVNMKPHYPPPGRPGGRPGDLKTPSSNTSMQGSNPVSNPPTFKTPR